MEEIEKYLRQAQDIWGRETVAAILNQIDQKNIIFNGTLRRSVSYELPESPDQPTRIFMADYGKFVDEGVNGYELTQNSSYSFKSIDSVKGIAFYIKPWADSKGLNNWAVAHNLAKKGIKPRLFFKSVVESRLDRLGVLATEALRQYTEDIINKTRPQ